MNRNEKQQFVSELNSSLQSAGLVVVTRQSGMSVSDVNELRSKMRELGAEYRVVKNTLARIAFKGTPYESLADKLSGPTALAFSEDAIAAAKAAVNYANDSSKFEVICGGLGDKELALEDVKALASLPSLDELRGKLVGVITAPAAKVARVVQAPASQLARVFAAYAEAQQ